MKLKCYNRKFSCSRGVTHFLFLSDNSLFFLLSPFSLFFTSQKIPLLVCLSPPFYKYTSCSYLYNCPIASQTLRDIFLYFIGFLPSLIQELWNSNFWGVFALFRLSHVHSIRQRLGENPLINAEVKIFNLLACSRHLLETIRGSYVQLASSKVGFLPFSQELFSHVALLLLGTWDGPVSFLPNPITL